MWVFFFLLCWGKRGVCVLWTDDRRGGLFFGGFLRWGWNDRKGGSDKRVLMPTSCKLAGAGGWGLLAIGFWLLAVGFWLLAFGFWLLAFGYWLWHIVNYEVFSSWLVVFFMFMV